MAQTRDGTKTANTREGTEMATATDFRIGLSISKSEAQTFLRLLATSDEFRNRLLEKPLDTLAEHNIHLPPSALPSPFTIPAKEVVQSALVESFGGTVRIDMRAAVSDAHWAFLAFFVFL